jgi:hypothetical protein
MAWKLLKIQNNVTLGVTSRTCTFKMAECMILFEMKGNIFYTKNDIENS